MNIPREGFTLCVDCDDSMLSSIKDVNILYNRQHKTAFSLTDYTTTRFSDVWGCSRQYASDFVDKIFDIGLMDHLEPLPGAADVLKELFPLAKKRITSTARPSPYKNMTIRNIERQFEVQFDEYFFTDLLPFLSSKEAKREFNGARKVDVMIEDNLRYANACAQTTPAVFLLDQYWNQGEEAPNVYRVSCWHQIGDMLIK